MKTHTKKVVSFMDIEQIVDFLESINCQEINRCIQKIADNQVCLYGDYFIFHDPYGLLED